MTYMRPRINEIELKSFESIGDHMSFDEFIECCDSGGFIDYDGFGVLAFADKKTNIIIRPSDFNFHVVGDTSHEEMMREIAKAFGYVVWYTR